MSESLLDRLAGQLRRVSPPQVDSTGFLVALSGGCDSVTLLAAASRLGLGPRLRCIHVDHRLHPDSRQWAAFCREYAAGLGIPIVSRVVRCTAEDGQGLEAAARRARYEAFAAELGRGEVLLSAHHGDDQLETLVFRLVRGTGVDGLRGIRAFGELGRGYVLRPWLDVTRGEIEQQARAWGLHWLEDPSNSDTRFDRNFLRRDLLPGVVTRWPGARRAAARLAAAAEDAAEIGAALAQADLGAVESLERLPLATLDRLSDARRRNVLRHAIRELGLPMPDAAALERIGAMTRTAERAAGCTMWPGAAAHRYGESLYLCARPAAPLAGVPLTLQPGMPCVVADGRLELEPAPAPALPDTWVRSGLTVRFRSGGERFEPARGGRARELREWMRESRLLPWMRDRIPLVYHGTELVAIADIEISAKAAATAGERGGWRIAWRDRPRTS
jgi:tRNA(Ile)-lysidine synthase